MKEFGRSRGKDEFDVYMNDLRRLVAGMTRCEGQGCGRGIVSSYAGEIIVSLEQESKLFVRASIGMVEAAERVQCLTSLGSVL